MLIQTTRIGTNLELTWNNLELTWNNLELTWNLNRRHNENRNHQD